MSLFNNLSGVLRRIGSTRCSHRFISLHHSLLFKKELSVPTFCNITVDVPFSINLKPLDVHKYRNCDRIFVELNDFDDSKGKEPLTIETKDNDVLIKDSPSKNTNAKDFECTIIAPIKANLNVHSKFGNINIKNFNGEEILVSSENGNINIDSFQGRKIDVKTCNGDVNFRGVLQSSLIDVLISERGSVSINKMLGEKTNIQTKLGNICVNSSYCNSSKFVIEKGDMDLRNIHKHCEVSITKSGNINIVSLDGHLKLSQASGNSNINLSRITEDSEMSVSDGHILLRLSEECQETIDFDIQCKIVNIKENVNLKQNILSDSSDVSQLDKKKVVLLICPNGSVDIEAASWFDMNFTKKEELN